MYYKNRLFWGDNLYVIKNYIPEQSIDLIYLDPPHFNDKELGWTWEKNTEELYNQLITEDNPKLSHLFLSYNDLFGQSDFLAYLVNITVRLKEMYRVLKSRGTIYLHSDSATNHYMKIVMDAIFGFTHYQNELCLIYNNAILNKEIEKYRFQNIHEIMLFYTKSQDYVFNLNSLPTQSHSKVSKYKDQEGREIPLMPFRRGIHVNDDHYININFLDCWNISFIEESSNEYLNFPTQKPEALLEKIIHVSSNEEDVILDPFCGSGTTLVVAENLNRNWVGIDISQKAISLVNNRLITEFGTLGGG